MNNDEERNSRAAYVHPAVFANRFSITLTGPFLRIGVSEQNPFFSDQLEPRGAVMLSTSDAVEMANAILNLVNNATASSAETAPEKDEDDLI